MTNRCATANAAPRPAKVAGFTLLELMIVVAIVALLATLAVSTYGSYAYRARRADGKDMIMRIANAQERFYTANNKYASLTDLAGGGAGFDTSEKGYYTAAIAMGTDNQTYTLSAVPQTAQLRDTCKTLTYTDRGVKGKTGDGSNGPCW